MALTVKAGDSLSAIAARELGDASRWREIYELNKDVVGSNPNLIHPGQQLRMPGDAGISPAGKRSALGLEGAAPAAAPVASAAPATPATAAQDGGPVRQGNAPWISQFNPAGNDGSYYNGAANCGPASMAMIARAFGLGEGLTDAKLINKLGEAGGTTADGTGVNGISVMARSLGLNAEQRGPGANVDWIAEQLRAGKMVVANGDYFAMAPHANSARVGTGGHYVAVVGMDANGNFLVNDPADRNVGAVSPADLARFIASNRNGGYQIAIG